MCPLYMLTGFGLKENRTCTSTLDTVCEPQDGFYCVDLAAGSCVAAHKHRQCEPGEYISQTGCFFYACSVNNLGEIICLLLAVVSE